MADTEHQEESKRCTLFDKPSKFCQRCSDFHTADEWMDHCERYMGAAPIRKCKVCGGWHPLDRWSGNCFPERNWNRSDLASPYTISDAVEVKSMIDGRTYDSKSRYYRHVRETGHEIVGNEMPKMQQRERSEREIEREIGQSVKDSLEQLRSGVLTDDAMGNMLKQPQESQGGFHVE